MKTRIIKTRMWSEDEKFSELSTLGKLGFLYYISNERIKMSGMYECPKRTTVFELGVTTIQLDKIQEELSSKRMVLFKDGWVFVVNAEKHNQYRNSPLNELSYQKEVSLIPEEVSKYFNSSMDSSMGGTMHSNHKQETINKKQEIRNKNILADQKIVDELKEKFPSVEVEIEIEKMLDWLAATGKTKKDYVAFARTWLRRAHKDKNPAII